mgnify:CR=1 FL=1
MFTFLLILLILDALVLIPVVLLQSGKGGGLAAMGGGGGSDTLFGSRQATRNASASGPAPRMAASMMSRASPVSRESRV